MTPSRTWQALVLVLLTTGCGTDLTGPRLPVATIELTAISDVWVGDTYNLQATPRDSDGTALVGRTITWSSSNLQVAAIDASGQLLDGTKVNGVIDLKTALMRDPEVFVETFTEKLMTYALGRGLAHYDMPPVRAIVRDSARSNYRFSSIVSEIVQSTPFQMRVKASGSSN